MPNGGPTHCLVGNCVHYVPPQGTVFPSGSYPERFTFLFRARLHDPSGAHARIFMALNSGNSDQLGWDAGLDGRVRVHGTAVSTGTATQREWVVLAVRNSPTLPSVWKDGVDISTGLAPTSAPIELKINVGSSTRSDCMVSDIVIFDSWLYDAEVEAQRQLILAKHPASDPPSLFRTDYSGAIFQGSGDTFTFVGIGLVNDASLPWVKLVQSSVLCSDTAGAGDAIAGTSLQVTFVKYDQATANLVPTAGVGTDNKICWSATLGGAYQELLQTAGRVEIQ
jgi:hypothetical protein